MSNILYIEKTEFKRINDSSYGLCIFDCYAKDYDNNLEKKEFDNLKNPKDILNLAINLFPDFFLDYNDNYSAISINDEVYSIEEINKFYNNE